MRNLYVFARLARSALAQNPAPPAFEVGSVKISAPTAYDTQRPMIAGSSWIDTERYDILAKAAKPVK